MPPSNDAEGSASTRKHSSVPSTAASPTQLPRVYNAIYSAVQVYECMVRNVAVMRRRADSYVNATQILKVAGIDKGRRTKILEKEILPGKHEIVQGGYGKYQGTWIPLDRGREIANQHGVAALLAPLFDYVPPTPSAPRIPSASPSVPRPPFFSPQPSLASQHYGSPGPLHYPSMSTPHMPSQSLSRTSPFIPQAFSPMLNPSSVPKASLTRTQSLGASTQAHTTYLFPGSPNPYTSPRPLLAPSALKRPREESQASPKRPTPNDIVPTPTTHNASLADATQPPPAKRARVDSDLPDTMKPTTSLASITEAQPSTKDTKTIRHRSIITAISRGENPENIINSLKHGSGPSDAGVDIILDEQGHTAIHFAASLSRLDLLDALILRGGDIRQGNGAGETPLMRCVLSQSAFQSQTFPQILDRLAVTIGLLDNSMRSVLHHVVLVAAIEGRASAAEYYMQCIFQNALQHGRSPSELETLVNMRDVHGDTALNLAARSGNQTLASTLLDVGGNPLLRNNLGLNSYDFGLLTGDSSTTREEVIPSIQPTLASSDNESNISSEIQVIFQALEADFHEISASKREQQRALQSDIQSLALELSQSRHKCEQMRKETLEINVLHRKVQNLETLAGLGWLPIQAISDTTHNPLTTMLKPPSDNDRQAQQALALHVPVENTINSLVLLRKAGSWQSHLDDLLMAQLANLQKQNIAKNHQCKLIVSICTGVGMEQLDEAIGTLTAAIDSEESAPDLRRIQAFMQKSGNAIN
ncbi:apses-domain-containing protein [Clavulina sp. PMI_390]|nr:apses-domain-containing protein [Clavulina sp. PMI_390]